MDSIHAYCGCINFNKLRGESAENYAAQFLQPDKKNTNRLVCKVCKNKWKRRQPTHEVSETLLTQVKDFMTGN